MNSKISIVKDGFFVSFLWEGGLWKKLHKQLVLKGLNLLYKTSSKEEAESVFLQLEVKAAKNLVVAWLSRKGFFSKQLQEKLQGMGVSCFAIEEVLVFCQRIGAIDDARLLQQLKEKEMRRGRGVKMALMKARRFVEAEDGNSQEMTSLEKEALVRFLQKKKIEPASLGWEQRKKLIFMLLQRGFAKENIDAVLTL